jgi:hypothetical protein
VTEHVEDRLRRLLKGLESTALLSMNRINVLHELVIVNAHCL